MTKTEQQALAALAVVGVAAAYVLLRRDDQGAPGAPVVGTGTAPVPTPAPAGAPAPLVEPSIFERAADVVAGWFGDATSYKAPAHKSPAQWRAELAPLFRQQESSFAIPGGLLEAVADRESAFRHEIITGEKLGGVGEQGIMQIDPKWHTPPDPPGNWFDPKQAIPYAAKYLAKNYLKFGTWAEAIAAYNWGPGNLERGGLAAAPTSTKAYIAWVQDRDYTAAFV